MNVLIARWVGGIIGTSLVVIAIWKGANVTFAAQWPLFEALRNTAAIIFAVVGAWLAIIFPERLRISFGVSPARPQPANAKFSAVFAPIVHSTFILAIVLLVGVIAPLMREFEVFVENALVLRRVSFGLLVGLTLWQVWTVILTLVPADEFKAAGDRDNRAALLDASLRSAAQKRPEIDDGTADR